MELTGRERNSMLLLFGQATSICLPPPSAPFDPPWVWLLLWPLFYPQLLRPKNFSSHTSSQMFFLLHNIFGDIVALRILPIITNSCHSNNFYTSWALIRSASGSSIAALPCVDVVMYFGVQMYGFFCSCVLMGHVLQEKTSWFFWLTQVLLLRTLYVYMISY